MDPAVLSYLTAQQMMTGAFPQLATTYPPPLLQSPAAMAIQIQQPQQLLTQPTPAQLFSLDQYYKPAAATVSPAAAAQQYALLQLLNNTTAFLPAAAAAPPPTIQPQLQPQPQLISILQQQQQTDKAAFLQLFEQLVQTQQAAANAAAAAAAAAAVTPTLQQPQQPQQIYLDQASALAALSMQQPSLQQAPPLLQPTVIQAAPTLTVVVREPTPIDRQPPPTLSAKEAQTRAAAAAFLLEPQPAAAAAAPAAAKEAAPAAPSQAAAVLLQLQLQNERRKPQQPPPAAAASTSKSSSVDGEEEEEGEELLMIEEEPEEQGAGRQRRSEHIAFHRKMKSLLKSLRAGGDLICKLCSVKVERHDNAFKAHIAEHADDGANNLECRYCGWSTPSRLEMNRHMGEQHPHGSERAYTDKRDHLKMIAIMNECFAKTPKGPVKRDPALVKHRGPNKKRAERLAAGAATAAANTAAARAAAAAASAAADEERGVAHSFEAMIVQFCTAFADQATEVGCACGDIVPVNPSSLITHVKTLHAHYRCTDCGDLLESSAAARTHTVRMHGGDPETFAERVQDHLKVDSVQKRFVACFGSRRPPTAAPLDKSYSSLVLRAQLAAARSAAADAAAAAAAVAAARSCSPPATACSSNSCSSSGSNSGCGAVKKEIKEEPMEP